MRTRTFLGIAAIPALLLAAPSLAASKIQAPVNTATAIHGAPGNTPGFGGSSASPNGNGVNGGNGIHNILGGAPGQAGYNPAQDGRGRHLLSVVDGLVELRTVPRQRF